MHDALGVRTEGIAAGSRTVRRAAGNIAVVREELA